jgi:hypothetical protein
VDEARSILEHGRTHEEPVLSSIISSCIRDSEEYGWKIDREAILKDLQETGKIESKEEDEEEDEPWVISPYYLAVYKQWMRERPEKMKELMLYYYKELWHAEDEVLERMRFAVSRGWGMMMIFD